MPIDKQKIIDANSKFASTFTQEDVTPKSAPRDKLAIVTCMDTWINEAKAFGIRLGDAHIIRNAGGSAREALRSLVVSQQMLGTEAIMLIKHTGCGMEGLTNEAINKRVKENLGVSAEHIDFLTFKEVAQAVRDDVEWLRTQQLMPEVVRNNISGYVFETQSGLLRPVIEVGEAKGEAGS